MEKEELTKLLDGRSKAWLGRRLKVSRGQIGHWCKGRQKIPTKRVVQIHQIFLVEFGSAT